MCLERDMKSRTGYSGTPLVKKLGIKEGKSIAVVGAPGNYWKLLGELPKGIDVREQDDVPLDMVHLFVISKTVLETHLKQAKSRIVENGVIWVSWPKKASGKATDLTEDVIREVALVQGLVDVKVCAIDEIWSGLKLVIPVKDRR